MEQDLLDYNLEWKTTYKILEVECLTSCSSLVRALVCQPSGPGSIPGMSRSETAITRGNPIMLLPPTTLCVLHAYVNQIVKKIVHFLCCKFCHKGFPSDGRKGSSLAIISNNISYR